MIEQKDIKYIKNGIQRKNPNSKFERKPDWLKVKLPTGEKYNEIKRNLKSSSLSTVCQEAMCPNLAECWDAGTATLMLMGFVCTRACKFCSVATGNPKGWLDKDEPRLAAESVKAMGLKYVVLTSVDRDDLPDGGASHYAAVIKKIKELNPDTAVEALTPDFDAVFEHIDLVLDSGIEVYAQNIETVKRLTKRVRDPRAGYNKTLNVLEHAKLSHPKILTKTSIMLGLGETRQEILETMDDLRKIKVDILTLGQYLQPTKSHLPVERYVSPEEFLEYRELGLEKGFLEVVSGPLVRSSYRAERALEKNNVGL